MHAASTSRRDDGDATARQWALCSWLNNIANSNGTLSLPTIYLTRAGGGGEGGRGLRTSNLSASGGVDGDTVFF